MKKIAIITGASSGIGREFVKQLDSKMKQLDEIWIIARRAGRLFELEKNIKCKVCVCPMDLTKSEEIAAFEELLKKEKPQVRMLVNASGYGVHGMLEDSNRAELLGMIDLNCRALTEVTYLCLPYIGKGGRIIQLASAAAFLPQPKFAVYAASKSYVLSFSRALNTELKGRRITVTAVCPGPVHTEFFEKDNCDINKTFYKRFVMAEPEAVVEKALQDSEQRREISVYSGWIQAFHIAAKLLPHKMFLLFLQCFA